MDNPRKVLIFYASAGHGHEKAARAIEEAYRQLAPGVRAEAKDTLDFASTFSGNIYRESYLLQIKYFPILWGIFYGFTDIPFVYFFAKIARRILNTLVVGRLAKYIMDEKPSVVIATHFTAVEVTSHLKGSGKTNAKLVSVVTDYLPHYVWTAENVDTYIVAAEETKTALMQKGISGEKIKVLGIPVENKFFMAHSRNELCNKFGIKEDIFTALITSGGAGIGAIGEIAEKLLKFEKPLQILMVCGTNKALYEKMSALAKEKPGLKVFGFVNNMDELMDTADIVVGKGGGLTITESFCKGRPVLIFRPVPGQETRNAELVQKYQAGYLTMSPEEVVQKISDLLEHPEKLLLLKDGVKRLAKPRAVRDIVEFVEHEYRS